MKAYKILFLALGVLLIGCSHTSVPTFDQMMEEMIVYRSTANLPQSYYVESETTLYENNKAIKKEKMKRWYESSSGRERIETYVKGEPVQFSVFNSKERIIYAQGQPKAFVQSEKHNQSGFQEPLVHSVLQMLQQDTSTHTIELVGEETIEGVETFYLVLKAKEQNAIVGDRQLWIDRKTWMLKKMVSVIGNIRYESSFKNFQKNPENLSKKFIMELPTDVEIVREETSNTNLGNLEELKSRFEQPFYFYPDRNGVSLQSIDQMNNMFTLTYIKEAQLYFLLTIKKTKEEINGDYQIRGNRAQLEKMAGLGHSLSWNEEGIRYTILDLTNVLSKEEIFDIATEMKKDDK
ncbi:outer membrane lipoprotein-sorting protein [Pseudoneobacillus sp. C159]